MLTYGGEVAAVHRRGDGWARWRRTGEAEVGDNKDAAMTAARGIGRRLGTRPQRIDPLGTALGEAVLWAGKSSGRRSGRTTVAHWAGK